MQLNYRQKEFLRKFCTSTSVPSIVFPVGETTNNSVIFALPVNWFCFLFEDKGEVFGRSGHIERLSFECRKLIGFAITTLRDWLKIFAPLFHPIRSKTKTNCDALACIFPRFASATCNYFEFWLVHCIVRVLCDWLEQLLWFWFYGTQTKTALVRKLYQSTLTCLCFGSPTERFCTMWPDRAKGFL